MDIIIFIFGVFLVTWALWVLIFESERKPLIQSVKTKSEIQTECYSRTATQPLQRTVRRKFLTFQRETTPGIYQPPAIDSESDYERQKSAYRWAMWNGSPAWSPAHQPFTQPLPLEAQRPRTKTKWQPVIPTFVYHYTNANGCAGILRDSKILASGFFGKRNGTLFGDGVYLTVSEPSSTTAELIVKNYGSFTKQFQPSRTQYVFKFRSSDLRGLRFINNRDEQTILLYPWSFVDLNACSYQTFKRSVEDYAGMLNEVVPLQRQPNFAGRYAP